MAHTLNEVLAYLGQVLEYCKDHCIDTHTPRDTEKEDAAKEHYQKAHDDLVEALGKIPDLAGSTLAKLLQQHYTYIAIVGDKSVYDYRTCYEYSLFEEILNTSKPNWFHGLVETDDIPPWNEFTERAEDNTSNYSALMSRFSTPVTDFAFRCMYAAKPNIPKPGGSDMDNDKYYQLQYIDCGAYELIKAFNLPIYTRDWDPTPDSGGGSDEESEESEDTETPEDLEESEDESEV